MMYPNDARSASSKVTRHHGLRARGEQMAGDSWQEMGRPVALRHTDLDNKELKIKDRCLGGSGQHVTHIQPTPGVTPGVGGVGGSETKL